MKCKRDSPLTLSAILVTKVRKLLGVITFLAILRIRRVIQADKAHVNIAGQAESKKTGKIGKIIICLGPRDSIWEIYLHISFQASF